MRNKLIWVITLFFCSLCGLGVLFTSEQSFQAEQIISIPPITEKALRFYNSGNILWIVKQALPILFLVCILWSGLSAKIRTLAKKWGRRPFFTWVIYFVLFSLLLFLLLLPLDYYSSYMRPHAYGLSNQSLGMWFLNTLKSDALTLMIGGGCVLMVYLLIKKSPKRWWMYASLLTLPFILLSVLITPLWIAPLFNHFGPMKDKVLEGKILALADRAGIHGSRVLEVDKSKETSSLNAYVTGFGSTKRIVLWDTITEKLDSDELLFVMGHEMGHYVLHHIEKQILFLFLQSVLLFYILSKVPYLIQKGKRYFKINALSDIASFPLLLLIAFLFLLAMDPISLALSRHFEREADCFGLEITKKNHAAASAFVKLQQQNLGNPYPGPLFVFWRASHPPLGERIAFCNTYDPYSEHCWRPSQP